MCDESVAIAFVFKLETSLVLDEEYEVPVIKTTEVVDACFEAFAVVKVVRLTELKLEEA